MHFVRLKLPSYLYLQHKCIQICQENVLVMMMLMRIINSCVNMQALTFNGRCVLLHKFILRLHIQGAIYLRHKRRVMNARDGHVTTLTRRKRLHLSASAILTILPQIIVFLSVKQMTAAERGNLGHLLRKPTARILGNTTRRHLSLCHLHIEIWLRRQMYIPGGPIDMTQKITHR